MNRRELLHKALLTVKGRVILMTDDKHSCGICLNTMEAASVLMGYEDAEWDDVEKGELLWHLEEDLHNYMKKWPKYSGEEYYPVDGESEYMENRYKWRNPKRIELLDWLIEATK